MKSYELFLTKSFHIIVFLYLLPDLTTARTLNSSMEDNEVVALIVSSKNIPTVVNAFLYTERVEGSTVVTKLVDLSDSSELLPTTTMNFNSLNQPK